MTSVTAHNRWHSVRVRHHANCEVAAVHPSPSTKPFALLQSHLLLCYYGFCDDTLYNVSVTLSPRYQSRSSMYIRGLIPWNFAEFAAVVPIGDALMCRLQSGLYCKLVKFLLLDFNVS